MTRYFIGPASAGANDGSSWANRWGGTDTTAVNKAEDRGGGLAGGDEVIFGPGPYRGMLTLDHSGGSLYATGTVTVTKGSAVVTGSGTSWSGNAFADGQFGVFVAAAGADGVTDGTSTFTSAAGNFQAAMVGTVIRINTKGAYIIASYVSATEITLALVTGAAASPSAGTGLTYNVGPLDVVEILSVDSNTQITLKRPWGQPTLTGAAYQTWRDIKYIADVSGHLTDGVGGLVRITGSDNDTTTARANCIVATSRDYRTFRGFSFDFTSSHNVNVTTSDSWIVEDCFFQSAAAYNISFTGDCANNTMRRLAMIGGLSGNISLFESTTPRDNTGIVIENCILLPRRNGTCIDINRIGGVTARNSLLGWGNSGISASNQTAGQTVTVNNCVLVYNSTGLSGGASGQITENYNSFYGNTTDRTNTSTGANSNAYPPLFMPPLLLSGIKYPWNPFDLSQWSALRAITGTGEASDGLYGIARPATSSKKSWGPVQFADVSRETTTVHSSSAASIKLADAGRHQIFMPVTAVSTTISVQVQWEANYAGTKPQLVIKQPGQSDQTDTATGSSGSWEELSITLTPAALPPYVIVELVSNNTGSGNIDTFFDTLTRTP